MPDRDHGKELAKLLTEARTPDEKTVRALVELSYTANERGLLEYAFDSVDAIRVIKLVTLAQEYGRLGGIPDYLKM